MDSVTIVQMPTGPAPLWVREAWIGLTLPTATTSGGPEGHWMRPDRDILEPDQSAITIPYRPVRLTAQGFSVPIVEALDILERASPEAAAWWRAEVPGLIEAKEMFVFDAPACRLNSSS